MPLPKSTSLRTPWRPRGTLRAGRARPQSWRGGSGRRGYSSQGPRSSPRQSKIDPTWLAASVAVTLPSTYFVYQSGPTNNPFKHPLPGDNYHGEGHGDEDEHEEEEGGDEGSDEGGETGDEGSSGDSEGSGEGGAEEGGDEGSDNTESKGENESDSGYESDSAQGGDGGGGKSAAKRVPNAPANNVTTKMTISGEEQDLPWDQKHYLEPGPQGQTRIHMPDGKGGVKKRVESAKGIALGRAEGQEEGPSVGDVKDGSRSAAAGQTSKQQKGISNTDTKHSTDIMMDPEKSKKSEGVPETAKLQGTVDPARRV